MKKLILLAISCWLLAVGADAAPALRGPFIVKQADETLLTIEQYGDEWHHWTSTTDGTLVVHTAKGYCIAQIDEQGQLSATDVLAHEPALRSSDEQAVIKDQAARRTLFHEKGQQAARRAAVITNGSYLQHTGSPRVLTILAAFQDHDFTVNNPKEAFEQYLNADIQVDLGNHNHLNVASVRQYFETCSHQKFSPQFDVVGPVTLPQNLKYYGGSNSTGSDDKFTEFCQDAMDQAKTLVSDWSVYDNDQDGNIELVCVIFAGYGQNQGGADSTIWAKASNKNLKLNDKLRITCFNCSPELFHPQYPDYINGTGVFIHEFSHCMGLPDLYATSSKAYVINQGMETYSIMDYGLYNYNSFAPCAYTAWEQEVMGWTEIEDVRSLMSDGSWQVNGMLPLIEGGKAYKLVNSDNDREYVVMENIQQKGLNKKSDGHGLLVYHVDYPNTSVNMTDSPNNNPGHPSVAVIPAGGILINNRLRGSNKQYTVDEYMESMASSPFPGAKLVTSLTDQMQLPNYCFWTASTPKATGFMLNDISEDTKTGAVSFIVAPDDPTGIEDVKWQIDDGRKVVYDLQGRKVTRPIKGIYFVDGRKVIIK